MITAGEARQISMDNSHRSFELFRESVYNTIDQAAHDGLFWAFWRYDIHQNMFTPVFVDDVITDLTLNGYEARETNLMLEDMHIHCGLIIDWSEQKNDHNGYDEEEN